MTDQLEKNTEPWGQKPAYSLRPDQPPEFGSGLVLIRQLEFAGIVFRHIEQRPATAVHELRKFTKRVRALLKLVSKVLAPGEKRTAMHLLRKLSSDLSAARESDIHCNVFQHLISACQQPSNRDARILAQAVGKALAQHKAMLLESHIKHEIDRSLAGLRTWMDSFSISDSPGDFALAELRKSYRRARKAPKHRDQLHDPLALHHWRKRVKTLWYHLRLLRPWLNNAGETYTSAIDELAGTLGDIHDLDTLKRSLVDDDPEADQAWASPELMSAWKLARDEYREAAYQQGQDLFAERPGRFLEMITTST